MSNMYSECKCLKYGHSLVTAPANFKTLPLTSVTDPSSQFSDFPISFMANFVIHHGFSMIFEYHSMFKFASEKND